MQALNNARLQLIRLQESASFADPGHYANLRLAFLDLGMICTPSAPVAQPRRGRSGSCRGRTAPPRTLRPLRGRSGPCRVTPRPCRGRPGPCRGAPAPAADARPGTCREKPSQPNAVMPKTSP
jgi:hypothetical protein